MKIKIRAFDSAKMITEESSVLKSYQILQRYSACMLFIGTKDKNGVDIYEGDILKFRKGQIRKVVFSDCAFAVQDESGAIDWSTENVLKNESEVIGNIYETPELLTVP